MNQFKPQHSAFNTSFAWAGGIEDTFIPQERPGLRALDEYELTQHYEQWREDLARAASLGIRMLRWGVPWYRAEPRPGQFDWAWTDEVLPYMVRELGIQPIIDLMHYGTPSWLCGSFAGPSYAESVATYAAAFARRYAGLVRFYTPLNEPTVNAEFCGRRGEWPPYLRGDTGYVRVLLQIARGIQHTARAIRAADPAAVLVAVEAMRWHAPATPAAQAAVATRDAHDLLAWDLVRGSVGAAHPLHGYLTEHGATEDDLAVLRAGAAEHDIFGVNFYPWSASTVTLRADGTETSAPVPSDGRLLEAVLRRSYEHTGKPLFVTETSARADIAGRAAWMDQTIAAVRAAQADGIPVLGYTWFPIITMIDWAYRTGDAPLHDYLLHLGLWDSEFDAAGVLVRHATPLVERFRAYVNNNLSKELS